MAELTGKRILITGAADGIGWAIAQICHREGADLVILDWNAELIEQRRQEMPDADWVQGDLSNDADLEALVTRITADGQRLDAVVHNAAVNTYASTAAKADPADWQKVFDINVRGAWMLTKLLLPHFEANGGGTVLTICSVHSMATYPAHFPYNLTKGALRTFVQSLAIDFADIGLRSVGIAPGWVHTTNIDRWLELEGDNADATFERVVKSHPSRRIGRVEEIGELASFLLSDRCPFLNGTLVTCDGGLMAQLPG